MDATIVVAVVDVGFDDDAPDMIEVADVEADAVLAATEASKSSQSKLSLQKESSSSRSQTANVTDDETNKLSAIQDLQWSDSDALKADLSSFLSILDDSPPVGPVLRL